MASNSFGRIFKMTTWGESHGKAMGVIVDGCPSGLDIDEEEINKALVLRAPGRNVYTSPRREKDKAQILSGVFEGKTTGAPISIMILNEDQDSTVYESNKHVLRPGHANATYLEKYRIFDYRGGGRSSARETVCRVAAGCIAAKILARQGIQVLAYIKKIGSIEASIDGVNLKERTLQSPLFCPDEKASHLMASRIEEIKKEGDSLGGVVEFQILGAPQGLGDPVYDKLEAHLAFAMLSLPASKAFEIGAGFESGSLKGSENNDLFVQQTEKTQTKTNHAGGVLGGISTGMPIVGRVVFKPTSSIRKTQETVTTSGEKVFFTLPKEARHDPCVAIRAVPCVDAMASIVVVDAILCNRTVLL